MTPRQIQKQCEKERAHAARMSGPFVVYTLREGECHYVKSVNHEQDDVVFTTDKSEAMTHATYEEARGDYGGRNHLEHNHPYTYFFIERK